MTSVTGSIDEAALEFYRTAGVMTDLSNCAPSTIVDLPTGPEAIAKLVQGLLVDRTAAAWRFGVQVPEERGQEADIHPVEQMISVIESLDARPLTVQRAPGQRLLSTCRHFATMSTAFLRHAGTAARARCGFHRYAGHGPYFDHWITEYWDAGEQPGAGSTPRSASRGRSRSHGGRHTNWRTRDSGPAARHGYAAPPARLTRRSSAYSAPPTSGPPRSAGTPSATSPR